MTRRGYGERLGQWRRGREQHPAPHLVRKRARDVPPIRDRVGAGGERHHRAHVPADRDLRAREREGAQRRPLGDRHRDEGRVVRPSRIGDRGLGRERARLGVGDRERPRRPAGGFAIGLADPVAQARGSVRRRPRARGDRDGEADGAAGVGERRGGPGGDREPRGDGHLGERVVRPRVRVRERSGRLSGAVDRVLVRRRAIELEEIAGDRVVRAIGGHRREEKAGVEGSGVAVPRAPVPLKVKVAGIPRSTEVGRTAPDWICVVAAVKRTVTGPACRVAPP